MEKLFTSAEVVRLTGITPRQLQWWDEKGVVVPTRQGHRRLYGIEDVTEIAVLCELRQRGFSLQRVRKLIRLLQREFSGRLAAVLSGRDCHLLTDGTHLYLETSPQQIVDILNNARQPILGVCLSDTVRQIRAGTGEQRKSTRSVPRVVRVGRKRAV